MLGWRGAAGNGLLYFVGGEAQRVENAQELGVGLETEDQLAAALALLDLGADAEPFSYATLKIEDVGRSGARRGGRGSGASSVDGPLEFANRHALVGGASGKLGAQVWILNRQEDPSMPGS